MAFFRRKARDDTSSMQALAEELNLRYAGTADDDYRAACGELPDVPLLREGSDEGISQLIYGELEGLQTQLFNFEVAAHAEDESPTRSCCLFTFEGSLLPELFLSPRDRLPRLGEKLREGGVAVGSPQLMERFRVQAHNAQHARDLIGPEVDAWLVDNPIESLRIEIRGSAILGQVPDLPGAGEFRTLLDVMHGFYQRIPERVWTLYRTF